MKRVLSLILAIVMVLSIMPMRAIAAENPRIYFETDFTTDMGVGDTFTVTGYLENNEIFSTMTLSLMWNENTVQFNGFDVTNRGALVTEVFTYSAPVINNANGKIVASDAYGYDTNGMMFVANFQIIADSGELGLGLKTDTAQNFEMADMEWNDIPVVLDFSAISGLTVGGAPVGPEMPEDAPFTAITTDAGPIVAIEEADWVNGVPYYIVTIPADAETAYVTAPDQVVMEDWTTGEVQATAYASDLSFSGEPMYISYNYEATDDGPKVEIPMNMVASDWSGEVELDFINTHAFGIEDANYACLGWISFVYDDGLEAYNISIDENMVGGTIYACDEDGNEISKAKAGETVFVEVEADEGYTTTGAYYVNGQIANDFMFVMPEEDVVLSATFTPVHTCEFKEVVHSDYLKAEATCEHGAEYVKSCECGKTSTETFFYGEPVDHSYVDGSCKWCGEAEPVVVDGYTVTVGDDQEIYVGNNVEIPVIIDHSADEKYNAFELVFEYDADVLELVSTKIEGLTIEVKNGVIYVERYGDALEAGEVAFKLMFKALKAEETQVKLVSAKVDISASALNQDAPDAEIIDGVVNVTVTGYTVALPEEFKGETVVMPGEDYTFEVLDKNYDYEVKAVINGEEVEVVDNGDGTYTIKAENITGNISITMEKTGKMFDVTLGEDLSGEDQAQYMTPYTATLTKVAGYGYKLSVTIGGETYTGFTYDDATGVITIPGEAITGEVVLNSGKEAAEFTVTFEGEGAGDADGEVSAQGGQSYTFTLNKEAGYEYSVTATMGGEPVDLTEENGIYTIAMVTGDIVITVEKTSDLLVEINEYVKLDGKTVFLVTATQTVGEGKALMYNGTPMYYVEQYEAWAYLVIVEEGSFSAEEAEALITVGNSSYSMVEKTYDVNETNGTVDINDAQLVYDLYNNVYQDFTQATMVKFLKADITGDKVINVEDAAAVVAEILLKK